MNNTIENKLDKYLLENVGENYQDAFNPHADSELKKAFTYLEKVKGYDEFEREGVATGEKKAKSTLDREIKKLKLSLIKKDEKHEKALKLAEDGRKKVMKVYDAKIKAQIESIVSAVKEIEKISQEHTMPGTFVIASSVRQTAKEHINRLDMLMQADDII